MLIQTSVINGFHCFLVTKGEINNNRSQSVHHLWNNKCNVLNETWDMIRRQSIQSPSIPV